MCNLSPSDWRSSTVSELVKLEKNKGFWGFVCFCQHKNLIGSVFLLL